MAIAEIFNVDPASINEESSLDTVNGWDSLGILNLVPELERIFNVQFDVLEIAEFYNVGIICSILSEKGVVFD